MPAPRLSNRGPKAPKPLMVFGFPQRDGLRRHPAGPGVRGSELEIAGSFESNPTPTRADRAARMSPRSVPVILKPP